MQQWAGVAAPFPPPRHLLSEWHSEAGVHPRLGLHRDVAVAYGELWVDESECEVELARIIVDPEIRGRGVGREFVRMLVAEADTFSLENIFLRVVPENTAAIRCYQSAGFVEATSQDQRRYNEGQPRDYSWMRFRDHD